MTLDLLHQKHFQPSSEIEFLEYQIYINPISESEMEAFKLKLVEVKKQLETVNKQIEGLTKEAI
jgi:hypothetical protein